MRGLYVYKVGIFQILFDHFVVLGLFQLLVNLVYFFLRFVFDDAVFLVEDGPIDFIEVERLKLMEEALKNLIRFPANIFEFLNSQSEFSDSYLTQLNQLVNIRTLESFKLTLEKYQWLNYIILQLNLIQSLILVHFCPKLMHQIVEFQQSPTKLHHAGTFRAWKANLNIEAILIDVVSIIYFDGPKSRGRPMQVVRLLHGLMFL